MLFYSIDFALFPKKYWFDQWYHLNRCGSELNTTNLLKELEKYFNYN